MKNSLTPYEDYIINNVRSLGPPIMNINGRIDDIHVSEKGGISIIERITNILAVGDFAYIIKVRVAKRTFEFYPTRRRLESNSMTFPSMDIVKKQDIKPVGKEEALALFTEEIKPALDSAGFKFRDFPFPVNNIQSFTLFLNMIDAIMQMVASDKKRYKIAVVFDDFHYLLQTASNPPMMGFIRDLFKLWQVDNSLYRGNTILLVTHDQDDLDPELRKYALPVKIPLPTAKMREVAAKRVLSKVKKQIQITEKKQIVANDIAEWSAGMTTVGQLVDSLWYSAVKHQNKFDAKKLRQDLIDKKREGLEKEFGGLVTYGDPQTLPSLKEVIIESQIAAESLALVNNWVNLVLIGPPGTGKTLFAQAIANELNLPFITLKGSLQDKYVGESEKRLMKVFDIAENFGGCVLFFDEIETMFPKRGTPTGSDVAQRMQGLLFQQLDGVVKRSRIIFIGATNFPQNLDLALLRRLTAIPIFPPDAEGVMDIAIIHFKKLGYDSPDLGAKVTNLFSDMDIMWTGATIAKIIKRAHSRLQYIQKTTKREITIFELTDEIIKKYRFPKKDEAQAIINACLDMVDVQDIIPERFRTKKPVVVEADEPSRF